MLFPLPGILFLSPPFLHLTKSQSYLGYSFISLPLTHGRLFSEFSHLEHRGSDLICVFQMSASHKPPLQFLPTVSALIYVYLSLSYSLKKWLFSERQKWSGLCFISCPLAPEGEWAATGRIFSKCKLLSCSLPSTIISTKSLLWFKYTLRLRRWP